MKYGSLYSDGESHSTLAYRSDWLWVGGATAWPRSAYPGKPGATLRARRRRYRPGEDAGAGVANAGLDGGLPGTAGAAGDRCGQPLSASLVARSRRDPGHRGGQTRPG